MAAPLTDAQIATALANLPGWTHENHKLTRTLKFAHFKEAMSFIVRVAFEAEAMNHHPEIFNVYSTVRLSLNTHDAGGKVTQKDVDLATAIEHFNWKK
jgi:4a-hydroxytetrahydrobiopterin dehydratase